MFIKNGIWDQIDKLSTFEIKPFTAETLTETLKKVTERIDKNTSSCSLYVNAEIESFIWDIMHDNKSIKVYGIKLVNIKGRSFIYEGILFDKFPDNYNLLYINYSTIRQKRMCEIEVIELTDTKIIFKCSLPFLERKSDITLQWD